MTHRKACTLSSDKRHAGMLGVWAAAYILRKQQRKGKRQKTKGKTQDAYNNIKFVKKPGRFKKVWHI